MSAVDEMAGAAGLDATRRDEWSRDLLPRFLSALAKTGWRCATPGYGAAKPVTSFSRLFE